MQVYFVQKIFPDTSVDLNGLQAGTEYQVNVQAVTDAGTFSETLSGFFSTGKFQII